MVTAMLDVLIHVLNHRITQIAAVITISARGKW
jgi:hypothetical protein